MQNDDALLGYLAFFQWQQKAYYGGLLVTNTRGVPREFRHTDAIKPSKLQTTLYGDSLELSLGFDTLAPALYEALQIKPDLLIIDREGRTMFGDFVQLHWPAALLLMSSDPEAELGTMSISPHDLNMLPQQDFELKGHSSERIFAYILEHHDTQIGTRSLELAHKRMNLFSPFERIRKVLSEVAQAEHGRTKT